MYQHFLLVEYPDGTFRVYEDDLPALRAHKPQRGEKAALLRRFQEAADKAQS